jgi:ribonuclease HI
MLYLFCDGASKGNPGPASIGVSAIKSLEDPKEELFSLSEAIGPDTNNVAEWKSLIAGVKKSLEVGEKRVAVFMDSQLVVKQVLGEYKIKQPHLKVLANEFQLLKLQLDGFTIEHIYRDKNKRADSLANLALQ